MGLLLSSGAKMITYFLSPLMGHKNKSKLSTAAKS
jgi:hypothetical protein